MLFNSTNPNPIECSSYNEIQTYITSCLNAEKTKLNSYINPKNTQPEYFAILSAFIGNTYAYMVPSEINKNNPFYSSKIFSDYIDNFQRILEGETSSEKTIFLNKFLSQISSKLNGIYDIATAYLLFNIAEQIHDNDVSKEINLAEQFSIQLTENDVMLEDDKNFVRTWNTKIKNKEPISYNDIRVLFKMFQNKTIFFVSNAEINQYFQSIGLETIKNFDQLIKLPPESYEKYLFLIQYPTINSLEDLESIYNFLHYIATTKSVDQEAIKKYQKDLFAKSLKHCMEEYRGCYTMDNPNFSELQTDIEEQYIKNFISSVEVIYLFLTFTFQSFLFYDFAGYKRASRAD